MNTLMNSRLTEIAALVVQGVECWQRAGELMCAILDEDPSMRDRIESQVKQLTPGTVRILEKIGRKKVIAEIAFSPGPGNSKLAMMPIEIQRRCLKEPVDVLFLRENGPEMLKVHVDDMTSDTAAQVFDVASRVVRPLEAQRAYIEQNARKNTPMPKTPGPKWIVRRGEVIIKEACRLTAQELGLIVAEVHA